MATPAQHLSLTTIQPMEDMKRASSSSSSTTNYYPLSKIFPNNILIIGGDMNDQIGKDGNNKFCSYTLPNRNREYLADFSSENRLACIDTKFKKKQRKTKDLDLPK